MRLAVTDACIFIDLLDLQIVSEFFNLPIEIHTSLDVFNELYEEQKTILKAYQSVGKLSIHNISSEEKEKILNNKFPKALSYNDRTVVYLAEKIEAFIITSDKAVRKYSKTKVIEYHGMLWIFDKMIEANLFTPNQAIVKINELVNINVMYYNNAELTSEINKRKRLWKDMLK